VVLLVLVAVGMAAFLPHLLHGGLYVDDWADLFSYRFAPPPRFTHAVASIHFNDPRPLLAYWKVAAVALFGAHGSYYLVLALLLGIAVSLLLAGLLSMLGFSSAFALAVAVLALLFPWSDSGAPVEHGEPQPACGDLLSLGFDLGAARSAPGGCRVDRVACRRVGAVRGLDADL
jgi:hypothetical protein